MDDETRLVATRSDSPTEVAAPTAHDELAAKIVAVLDAIAEQVPDLQTPHPSTKGHVRGARTVPPEFVASLCDSIEAVSQIRELALLDVAKARDVMQSRDSFRVVVDRLNMLLTDMKYTMEAHWAKVVGDAMATYAVVSRLARNPANAEIAAHVEKLRRILARENGTKRKKSKKPPASED